MTPPPDRVNGVPPVRTYHRQIRFNGATVVYERPEAEKAADREAYALMCQGDGFPPFISPQFKRVDA